MRTFFTVIHDSNLSTEKQKKTYIYTLKSTLEPILSLFLLLFFYFQVSTPLNAYKNWKPLIKLQTTNKQRITTNITILNEP